MKHTWLKAAVAAGLSLTVALGLAGPAGADTSSLVPATGDLVIHKYIGAPVTGTADGTEQNTAGWTDAVPANGVVFDLFEVGAPVDPPAPADPWPGVPLPGTYARNATTGHLEVLDGTTLIGEYALTPAATASVTTGPNGTATAAGLPQGLYLVTENAAASTTITNANTGDPLFISAVAAPFVVAVPMTNAAGDGWLDQVHVYPKNEQLSVTKTVDAAGATAVGDTVSYTITVSVPGDIATSQKYIVRDQLDAALDLVTDSTTVATQPALAGADALVAATDYLIAYDDATRTLSVTFTDTGRAKLAKATSVVVTLDTTVNATILAATGLAVPNTAYVDFTNSTGTDFTADSGGGDDGSSATIHGAAIQVTKVDQAGQALNGATFKLATSQANAKAGNFLRLDPVTKQLVDYDAAADSAWATLGAANDYAISPANTAEFVGLKDQIDVGGTLQWQTYWVMETVAPAGYNLVADPIEVSFESAFAALSDPTTYDHVYHLTVKNAKGFLLPATGGVGTIVLTVVGIVLVGSGVLLAVTKRKQNRP